MMYQEKSAYKEPAYKELPLITNWFSFPNIYKERVHFTFIMSPG